MNYSYRSVQVTAEVAGQLSCEGATRECLAEDQLAAHPQCSQQALLTAPPAWAGTVALTVELLHSKG